MEETEAGHALPLENRLCRGIENGEVDEPIRLARSSPSELQPRPRPSFVIAFRAGQTGRLTSTEAEACGDLDE